MISIQIPEKYRQTKSDLNKNFAKFRFRPSQTKRASFTVFNDYDFDILRDNLRLSDVLLVENFNDDTITSGIVGTKKNHISYIPLTKETTNGKSRLFLLDAEDGIKDDVVFKDAKEAVDFAKTTFGFDVIGARRSSSGKDGHYHLWVLFDKPIEIKTFKAFMAAKTPDQRYILSKAARPTRLLRNPYFDPTVYAQAKLTFGMRSNEWLYTSDKINKSTMVTKSLPRLVPVPVKKGYSEFDLEAKKEFHRKQLGLPKVVYDELLRNNHFTMNEVIYDHGNNPVMAKDAEEGERYNLVPYDSSPSLQCNGNGEFYDFRGGVVYTTKNIYLYDKYISDSGLDFEQMVKGVVHSHTGSGKTFAFAKPKTLIAVPRRSQTTIKTGLCGEDVVLACREKVQYITHDKLATHMNMPFFVDLLKEEGIRIVIDEAHKLVDSKKFSVLWSGSHIFLSGTLRESFRPDLDHLFFERKKPISPIIIADGIPKSDRKTLYFMDRAKMMIANDVPMLTAEDKYIVAEEYLNKHVEPPKLLTEDTFATSAYAEGVTIPTDGSKWRVVVYMPYCPTWSLDDAVQAVNRIRGDDVERVIVRSKKDRRSLEAMTASVDVDIDKKFNFIKTLAVTDENALRGAGLKEGFSKKVYGGSGYTEASLFGYLQHLTAKHRLILPDTYSYELLPQNAELMSLPLNVNIGKDIYSDEPTDIPMVQFILFHEKHETAHTDIELVHDWAKAKNIGVIDRLIDDVKTVDGEISKLISKLRYLKKGKGRIDSKKMITILRRLMVVKMYGCDEQVYERYNSKITHIEIVKECHFEYANISGFRAIKWA